MDYKPRNFITRSCLLANVKAFGRIWGKKQANKVQGDNGKQYRSVTVSKTADALGLENAFKAEDR